MKNELLSPNYPLRVLLRAAGWMAMTDGRDDGLSSGIEGAWRAGSSSRSQEVGGARELHVYGIGGPGIRHTKTRMGAPQPPSPKQGSYQVNINTTKAHCTEPLSSRAGIRPASSTTSYVLLREEGRGGASRESRFRSRRSAACGAARHRELQAGLRGSGSAALAPSQTLSSILLQ
jgi:hypothetical protein